ncbi:MAG: hypothetical protein Q8P67_23735, partial [archaeon]|nr:hypothetical protein [archaeon]
MSASSSSLIQASQPIFDAFLQHLLRICPPLLDVAGSVLEDALATTENRSKLFLFIREKSPVLLLSYLPQAATEEADGQSPASALGGELDLSLEVSFHDAETALLIFLKTDLDAPLSIEKSFAQQLRLLQLGAGSPFETLHSVINGSFVPYFSSFLKNVYGIDPTKDQSKERSNLIEGGMETVHRTLNELQAGLFNCKQNVQIEHVDLQLHPEIRKAAEACREKGVAFTIDHINPALFNDDRFLRSLHHTVDTWLAAIQKVTKHGRMDQLPEQSDLSQEIKFWLELDNELREIESKLDSDPVKVSLEILRRAKRHMVTFAFNKESGEIGLKAAKTKVDACRPLMASFPLNALITATEIPQLQVAIHEIFSYLSKSKGTQYPVQRSIELVGIIWKDLSSRLISLLRLKRLMALPYPEFEKVANATFAVFAAWDEADFSYKDQLRKAAKARGRGTVPIFVVDYSAFKRALTQVCEFRKEHRDLLA